MMRIKLHGKYISFTVAKYPEMARKYSKCQVSFTEWTKAPANLKEILV